MHEKAKIRVVSMNVTHSMARTMYDSDGLEIELKCIASRDCFAMSEFTDQSLEKIEARLAATFRGRAITADLMRYMNETTLLNMVKDNVIVITDNGAVSIKRYIKDNMSEIYETYKLILQEQ